MKSLLVHYGVFLLLFVGLAPGTSQSGFNKLIDIPHILGNDFDDILLTNNTLVVRGDAYVDSIQKFGLLIARFDTNGILLSQQTLYSDLNDSHLSTNSPCRFIRSGNRLVIPTYYFNTGNLGVFFTDTFGNKLIEVEYPNTEFTIYPVKILELNKEYYIFGRVVRKNYISDDFVLKVDSVGNKIWLKYYGFGSWNEYFGDAILNDDQTFTISTRRSTPDIEEKPVWQWWIRPWIYTIDTSGTRIYEWLGDIRDERTLAGGPLYRCPNGDLIGVSKDYKEIERCIARSPTITKLDDSFNLIWKKQLTDFTGCLDELVDIAYDSIRSEFVAVGRKFEYYTQDHGAFKIWAIKFKADGEIVWNISDTVYWAPIDQSAHLTAGLEISKSGSIYVAGSLDHYSNPSRYYGWLAKITPDGCMETLCSTTSNKHPNPEMSNLVVYPNPCRDYLEIVVPFDQGLNDSQIAIFNLNGSLVSVYDVVEGNNKFKIDLSPGLYFYSLVDNQNKIISIGKLVMQ